MKVTLTVIKGPGQGRVVEFHEPRGFILGRAKDTDVRLSPDDLYVSRRHVFLEICPPSCRIRDIGTTNPPYVNDAPFTERDLHDGDIVEIGYTQLKISIIAQGTPRTWRCSTCGESIELLPGDAVPERCPACVEAKQRQARAPHATRPVRCPSCKADLTARANSDGRAEEFHTATVYACEQCLPHRDAFTGVTLGGYEVGPLLGEGGMGIVHLGYHRPTARLVALKKMKDLKDALLVKRFHREMRLLQGVVHRNVVRCMDRGIDDAGMPYLVTEYVPHGCLEDHVATQGGRLSQGQAIGLICEVLDSLACIHAQSIIHRDIKPQNILLRGPVEPTTRSPYTPKIADFGLAVSYARAGGTRLTQTGTGLGTLMFMPPEQVHDAGEVREPADLYAVGVTLYYLLTGQYSFNFPTPEEILIFQRQEPGLWKRPQDALRALLQLRRIMHPFQIILSDEPVPVRQRDASLPRKLAEVVDKAVRKEVGKRFQSAAEFRDALQRAVR